MKKYTVVLLTVLIIFVAVAASVASAAENISNGNNICKVIATHYKCDSWSDEQYPLIDLCEEEYVPLFSSEDEIWQSHVNKLAGLILDSNETHTLKPGETLDLGNGYALEVREIDIDSEDVWLEFTKDGQHVSDQNVLVDADGNSTWTVTLDNVQGENDVVVMKINVKQVFVGTETSVIWIDGIWLIDYASARTLTIGDKIGEFTLKQIIGGVDASDSGSLVFVNISVTDATSVANYILVANETSVYDSLAIDFSVSPSREKELAKFTNKSTGLPTSWYWNFWRAFNIKSK